MGFEASSWVHLIGCRSPDASDRATETKTETTTETKTETETETVTKTETETETRDRDHEADFGRNPEPMQPMRPA